MFCSQCGSKLPDGAVVCPDCGAKVGKEISFSNVTNHASQRMQQASQYTNTGGYSSNIGSQKPNPAPSSKPPKFPWGIVIAIASCASVAVIAAGVFMYFGSRDNKNDSKSTQGYEETVRGTEAVVKDTTEALSESSTEAPASAETPDIHAILAAYQQYADGMKEYGPLHYTMLYLNDDDVPECFIWTNVGCGFRILSYADNAVISFASGDTGTTYQFFYTPRSGRLMELHDIGSVESAYHLLTLDKFFTETAYADRYASFDSSVGQWVADYRINDESVTEDEWQSVTDESAYEIVVGGQDKSMDTYDSILSAYNALASPEQSAPQEVSEFILPESNLRYMTYNDLKGIDATNLRIAKNEIYARHGRMFQSEDLSQYFNSKSWYSGTVSPDSFSDRVFNDFESGNISMIQYFQDGTPNGNYYAFAFQYKYFNIDSGVLTVFASPISWGGEHEGYALSLPISDNCIWWRELEQKPFAGGKDEILRIISDECAEYQKSPSHFEDPIGISVEVEGGVVVAIKVYVS